MDYRERFDLWMREIPEADALYRELEELAGNDKELRERFFQDMHFGTAGLRGIVGAGTNCMNYYTVGRATRGIARYICAQGEEAKEKGVIIAHDPRHFSKEFSRLAACILARTGIRVYTFPAKRLESEADIDTYVEKIRDQLKQLLKNCDGIQLK